MKVVSSDNNIVKILDLGNIGVASSYGTAIITSAQKSGQVIISSALGGLGSGSNTTSVITILEPVQTKIFSPAGSDKIVFNDEGYSELFFVLLDSSGRPVNTKNPSKYLITPVNSFVEIGPKQTFAKMQVYSSSFGGALRNGTSMIGAIPIGVEAKSSLGVGSDYQLIPSSATAKILIPFENLAGVDNINSIGTVQLADFYGNPVMVSDDLTVNLKSNNTQAVQVPSFVTIPKDNSFVEFPITTFGKKGSSMISASAENVLESETLISVNPFSTRLKISLDPVNTPISYNQDVSLKIYVDSENNQPQQGALVKLTPGTNATVTPNTVTTDETASATFLFKPLAGPTATLIIHASMEGYVDAEKTIELDVTGFKAVSSGAFFGVPSWIMYVGVAAAVGGIAYVAIMFLRKPKPKAAEEEEEI